MIKLYLLLALSICAINANGINKEQQQIGLSSVQKNLNQILPEVPRAYNKVTIGANSMPADRIYDGADRLEYLLGYNTKNKELLQDLNRFFQKYNDLDWHFSLEHTSAGAIPVQYVYYKFDRGNSELFVGGYKRC